MLILENEMFHSTSQLVVRKTVYRFLRMQREIKRAHDKTIYHTLRC